MVQVAEIAWQVSGDIGGVGVSRFRFVSQTTGALTTTNANAVAAASRLLLNATAGILPTPVTWTCQPQVDVYESDTGLVDVPLVLSTVPAAVTGSGGSNFAAGTGARVNWKTDTIRGRRLMRGCTFLVPLVGVAFGASGALQTTQVNAINAGAAAYLSGVTSAGMNPVVWHRPAKGTFSGGMIGIIFAGVCSPTPATLRSRKS